MDKAEARRIAERELEIYRRLSYEQIAAKRGTQESFERTSEVGDSYQIEFEFFDDDSESGNLRVSGAVSYKVPGRIFFPSQAISLSHPTAVS